MPNVNSPDLTDIGVDCLGNNTAIMRYTYFNCYGADEYIRTAFLVSYKRTHTVTLVIILSHMCVAYVLFTLAYIQACVP